jgi:hypothetical protein
MVTMPTAQGLPCGHDVYQTKCVWCRHAAEPRYARLFGRPHAPQPAACAHLGAPTGRTAACPSCTGRVELKLFACAVHG